MGERRGPLRSRRTCRRWAPMFIGVTVWWGGRRVHAVGPGV